MLKYERQTIKLARKKEKELLHIMPNDKIFDAGPSLAEFNYQKREYRAYRYFFRRRICQRDSLPITTSFAHSRYFLEDYDELYQKVVSYNQEMEDNLKFFQN